MTIQRNRLFRVIFVRAYCSHKNFRLHHINLSNLLTHMKLKATVILALALIAAIFHFFFPYSLPQIADIDNRKYKNNSEILTTEKEEPVNEVIQNPSTHSTSVAVTILANSIPKYTRVEKKNNQYESSDTENEEEGDINKEQKAWEAAELERLRTLDPALGYVPTDRRQKAIELTMRMQQQMLYDSRILRGSLQKARWIERGPGNVGGRTRAILVDLNDPTRQTVFAGGATGGLFKTTKINSTKQQWEKINDWLDFLTVSSIAQNPINPKIMYIGTGDTDSRDAPGNGIYKSVDGGANWRLLPATTDGNFTVVSAMVVSPDNGHILAATFGGVYKSKDDGETWYKVLGTGLRFGSTDDKFYKIERAIDGRYYACNTGKVFKSMQAGEAGTWENLSKTETNFPSGWSRTEIAVAPSNPDIIYAVGSVSNRGTAIYLSNNGGTSWQAGTKPSWKDGCGANPSDADFTRGQAWYDLLLVVSPTDPQTVFVGGVDFFRSRNSGQSWTQMTMWSGNCGTIQYAHADQHGAIFEPNNPNVLYIGTDGGVFRIDNPSDNFLVKEKTDGYNTTQFYSCAIHPDSLSYQLMAGAQDNGTLIVRTPSIGTVNGRSIGGDGFLCFIDQNEPNIQIGSIYYGDWRLSTNEGFNFSSGARSSGGFFNPADYDDVHNILYAQSNDSELWRWKLNSDLGVGIEIEGTSVKNVSHVYVDKNKKHRVYLGTSQGKVYRLDNASEGTNLSNVALVGSFSGFVSSITVAKGDTNHILVTLSSYGVPSVMESTDGGGSWTNIEGNLPDMPVRWAVFNPADTRQVFLATEGGVWSSNQLNGTETIWYPPFPGRGTPIVRTDMLQIRESDLTVVAATYGRGLWTSTALGAPKAVIDYNGVSYITAQTQFKGEASNAADNFLWNFGDGSTDTLENTLHIYNQIGTYTVSLKINGEEKLTSTSKIKILPQLPTPYKANTSNYLGNFETGDEHFGAYSRSGSSFQRGKSAIIGKSGTHSGNNAYVLGINEQAYQKNTTAYLYLPMFDMTQRSIYQFSFWAFYDIQNGYDGMQVEYTLDKGLSWQLLGSGDDANWYSYKNTTVTGGAFPIGNAYFSGQLDDWTRFKINISSLAGNATVAFRFAFKSDSDLANGAGIAIDDVEITRYEGVLKTAIVNTSGAFAKTQTSIEVNFQTQPEYFAKTFELEMSENGKTFKKVATFNAKGVSTEELNTYAAKVDGTPFDIYYFRVKSINFDAASNYQLEFYSSPFVISRFKDAPLVVNKVYPSPFKDFVGVLFTGIIQEDVEFQLYDVAGRLVTTEKLKLDGIYHEIKTVGLPKGIYLLSVKIGHKKGDAIKLFGGN